MEIRPSRVGKYREAAMVSVSGQNTANELIRKECTGCRVTRKFIKIENVIEVSVARDEASRGRLESGLRQFGFDQKIGKTTIYLCPVGIIDDAGGRNAARVFNGVKRNTNTHAKSRPSRLSQAEKILRCSTTKQTRVAKDIHKKSVGTCSAIEFAMGVMSLGERAIVAAG